MTSEAIAASVNTNPVVIRRVLLALQRGGIVETQKGAGAGSKLARCPREINLDDVYRAVETKIPFLLPLREPSQECPVGQGIKSVLRRVFASVENAMENELKKTTLQNVREAIECCAGAEAPRSEAPIAAHNRRTTMPASRRLKRQTQ